MTWEEFKQMELIAEYQEKLDKLKAKMLKAQAFAEKVPCLAKEIIKNIWTDEGTEEGYDIRITRYKDFYFAWPVLRRLFKGDPGDYGPTITNYDYAARPFQATHLWSIYVNYLSVFDIEATEDTIRPSLDAIHEATPVFYYNKLNSEFYVTDEQLGAVLEALVEWRREWLPKVAEVKKEQEKQKLLKKLAKLKGV